jgi:hypothetical protein
MPEASDGLSDVLRQMAENPDAKPEPDAGQALPDGVVHAEGEDDLLVGEVDDESGDIVASSSGGNGAAPPEATSAARAAARPGAASRTYRPSGPPSPGLKAVAVPVLLTVGVLLLIPGVWAILLLCGADVWKSDDSSAKSVALIMLLCWPIAACLLAAAAVYLYQIQRAQREYQDRRRREQMQEEEAAAPAAPPPRRGTALGR